MQMLKLVPVLVYIIAAVFLVGCPNDALLKANQEQLEAQQSELNQLKQEMETVQNQHHTYNYPSSPPGSCDTNIMREATRKGGASFAAGDLSGALSYYQDALTACPQSAQANLNLARTYEAVGDRAQAVQHYRDAANANGTGADVQAAHDARAALSRLGG